MATIDQDLEAAQLKAFHALASPTQAQVTAIVKVLNDCVARLIFSRLNHPDDTP